MKKIIVSGLAAVMLVTPMLYAGTSVYAAEDISSSPTVIRKQNEPLFPEQKVDLEHPEVIYKDTEGNVFTNSEVLVQVGENDPRIQTRSMGASVISVGVKWTYTTKADGTRLRDAFRKVAFTDGSLGAITAALTLFAIPLTGIVAVLGGLVSGAGFGVWARFSEGADLINAHPNSGKIYMYADHVTYSK